MKKTDFKSWDELPLLLNVKQVAELTGYGPQTIRELCHTRQIPSFRLGRAFVIPRDSLRDCLQKMAENSSEGR